MRAITKSSIARVKCLQIRTLLPLRSMRAIFCGVFYMVEKVISNYLWR